MYLVKRGLKPYPLRRCCQCRQHVSFLREGDPSDPPRLIPQSRSRSVGLSLRSEWQEACPKKRSRWTPRLAGPTCRPSRTAERRPVSTAWWRSPRHWTAALPLWWKSSSVSTRHSLPHQWRRPGARTTCALSCRRAALAGVKCQIYLIQAHVKSFLIHKMHQMYP